MTKSLTRDAVDSALIDKEVGLNVDLTSVHGAESLEIRRRARVDLHVQRRPSVDKSLDLSSHIA